MARLLFYRNKVTSEAPLFSVRLRQGRTRIGRTDDCDLVLPDNEISRSHAIVDVTDDACVLTDRSSNGTFRNSERIKSCTLQHNDILKFGPFLAITDLKSSDHHPPTEEPQPETRHEDILEVHEGLTLLTSQLVVRSGPGSGDSFRLKGGRISVGGRGSKIVLPDPTLVKDHVFLRLYEGRAMIEPGAGAVWFGRTRVRDIFPLNATEEVRIGATEITVIWDTRIDSPMADRFGDLVGKTPMMQRIFGNLRRMAAHEAPILILGASGTGKELCARGIHDASPRAGRPFVVLNCGAIPQNLFESELFGHERGSFTGATERRDGAFLRADGGTLFLDEIGELPEEAQVKLLRVLESGEVRRVGGNETFYPDVRIVAATNRNLLDPSRRFRQDLYFRLSVLSINLPTLKEHPEDVGVITEALLRRNHPGTQITPEAVAMLQAWSWPGNVRELRNVLTRAFVMGGSPITHETLEFQQTEAPTPTPGRSTLEEAERELVLDTLRRNGNNRTKAARALGIPRTTLIYKLQRWGIEPE